MGWISDQKATLTGKREWDKAEIQGHGPQGIRTIMSSDLETFLLDSQRDQNRQENPFISREAPSSQGLDSRLKVCNYIGSGSKVSSRSPFCSP